MVVYHHLTVHPQWSILCDSYSLNRHSKRFTYWFTNTISHHPAGINMLTLLPILSQKPPGSFPSHRLQKLGIKGIYGPHILECEIKQWWWPQFTFYVNTRRKCYHFQMKMHQNARDLSILIRLIDIILSSLQNTENMANSANWKSFRTSGTSPLTRWLCPCTTMQLSTRLQLKIIGSRSACLPLTIWPPTFQYLPQSMSHHVRSITKSSSLWSLHNCIDICLFAPAVVLVIVILAAEVQQSNERCLLIFSNIFSSTSSDCLTDVYESITTWECDNVLAAAVSTVSHCVNCWRRRLLLYDMMLFCCDCSFLRCLYLGNVTRNKVADSLYVNACFARCNLRHQQLYSFITWQDEKSRNPTQGVLA